MATCPSNGFCTTGPVAKPDCIRRAQGPPRGTPPAPSPLPTPTPRVEKRDARHVCLRISTFQPRIPSLDKDIACFKVYSSDLKPCFSWWYIWELHVTCPTRRALCQGGFFGQDKYVIFKTPNLNNFPQRLFFF